jgi:hypothetical protein
MASAPAPPSRTLAALLPTSVLARLLPVPLIAGPVRNTVRVSIHRTSPLWTTSKPPEALFSNTWSALLSTM